MKKIIQPLVVSFGLALLAFIAAMADVWNGGDSNKQIALTFAILALTHFVFRVIFFYILQKHVAIGRTRYALTKILTAAHLFIAALFILRVWLPDSNTLLAAYGFIAAAIALATQDIFRNIIGGAIILIKSPYDIGDRIEINGTYGDIIDIGILFTTLLEIREWVHGDQAAGRIVQIANGKIITHDVKNYTRDHSFIWDEILIPITHESDWQKAEKILQEILEAASQNISMKAMQEIANLKTKYFLQTDDIEPHVYFEITDNWVSLYARYVVEARRRRSTRDKIMREIKTQFDAEKHIQIASDTSTVTMQ